MDALTQVFGFLNSHVDGMYAEAVKLKLAGNHLDADLLLTKVIGVNEFGQRLCDYLNKGDDNEENLTNRNSLN